MTSMMAAAASQLSQQEIDTTRVDGRMIKEWTASDLRAMLSLIDPNGGSRRSKVKADLSREVYENKDRALSTEERRAIREYQFTRSMRAARIILKGETFVKKEGVSEVGVRVKIEPGMEEVNTIAGTSTTSHAGSARRNRRINTEYDLQRCEICFDDLGMHHFPKTTKTAACQHEALTTCIDCLAAHIEAEATASSLDEISCPETDCSAFLSYEQMQAYAPRSVFARYNEYSNVKYITENASYLKCANRNCLSGVLIVDVKYAQWFTCHDCKARTCVECHTLWHPDEKCEENQAKVREQEEEEARFEEELQRLEEEEERKRQEAAKEAKALQDRKNGEERATDLNMGFITKKCPNEKCGVRITKSTGCDHMTCKSNKVLSSGDTTDIQQVDSASTSFAGSVLLTMQ